MRKNTIFEKQNDLTQSVEIYEQKCMKSRNKIEKEGQKGLTGLQGQKPCKNLEGKRQKLDSGA